MDRCQRRTMIGSYNQHRVDGFILQKLSIIAIGGARTIVRLFHLGLGALQVLLVHITHGDGVLHQAVQVAVPLSAQSDKADADKLARLGTGGSFGFVEKNIRTSETQSSAQNGVPGLSKKMPP